MTMQVISAVAEFEKDLLIECTHSGLARAAGKIYYFGHLICGGQIDSNHTGRLQSKKRR